MMDLVIRVECFYNDGVNHAYRLDCDMEDYTMETYDFIADLYAMESMEWEDARDLAMWHVREIFDIFELDIKKAEGICLRVWDEFNKVCYFDTDFSFNIENKEILENAIIDNAKNYQSLIESLEDLDEFDCYEIGEGVDVL